MDTVSTFGVWLTNPSCCDPFNATAFDETLLSNISIRTPGFQSQLFALLGPLLAAARPLAGWGLGCHAGNEACTVCELCVNVSRRTVPAGSVTHRSAPC